MASSYFIVGKGQKRRAIAVHDRVTLAKFRAMDDATEVDTEDDKAMAGWQRQYAKQNKLPSPSKNEE